MRSSKKILLSSLTLGAAIIPVAGTIACNSNKIADLRVVLDEQEVNLFKPRLNTFAKAVGKTVGFATVDNDRIVQQLQQLKLSGQLPDVLQAQDPALMQKENLIQKFSLRELFSDATWSNDDVSGPKLEKNGGNDLDFYNNIKKNYDMSVFAQVLGKPMPTNVQEATTFLDAKILGLPTGVTGWGIWIRRNKMDEEKVISHYLKDGKDTTFSKVQIENQKTFADAWANDPSHLKLDGNDIILNDIWGTISGSGKGSGKGFKTTPEGIEAFVAMSADKDQKNSNWANDKWYSIGFTGQYQRTMAAFYNAAKTGVPILWDGPMREGMLAEQFKQNGEISYGTSKGNAAGNIAFDNSTKKFQNAVLLNRITETPSTLTGSSSTIENQFWKRWYNTTLSYKIAKTSEEAYGEKDPAKNFWFAADDKKAAGLAFGQQWMTWPLKQKLTDEAESAYKSVVSVAVPFSAKGTQSYAIAAGLTGQKKTDALKLLRLMFSKNSQKITAGKLQSTHTERNGVSISLAVTQQAKKTDKNSLVRGMFRPVLPASKKLSTDNSTFISSYENPTTGDESKWPLFSGIVNTASTYIRTITEANRTSATNTPEKWLTWYNTNFKSEIQKAINAAVDGS